jgi:hypothetical protein
MLSHRILSRVMADNTEAARPNTHWCYHDYTPPSTA